MAKKPHVLIVGAGIGGLTAALALLERGFDVDVYERSPELREVGAGLHVSPNGSRVLRELGLAERYLRDGVQPTARYLCLWDSGQTWEIPNHNSGAEARFGSPYLCLHRGDLHAMLVDGVRARKPDAIHIARTCTSFVDDGSGVTVTFEDGETVRGDILIGADGIHSVIQKQLFGPAEPKFTGYVAWRGLVPMEQVPERFRTSAANWISTTGSITLYPVRRGELLNFIGNIEREDWRVESWIVPGTIEECARDFAGWHDDIQKLIQGLGTPFKWGVFTRDPIPQWTKGRVTLLGDACHSTRPTLGQGANMAIEDGLILARALEIYDDPESALSHYEAARRPRCTAIVQKSLEQASRRHAKDLADPVTAARYIESQWSPDKVVEWYDWIYGYDAATVAV